MNHPDDQLLDQAVDAVRESAAAVPDAQLDAAVDRLRERLAFQVAAPAVFGCAEIQELLAARQRGELSPARATLVSDHVKDCFACRRAERELREAALPKPAAAVASGWSWMRAAVAATLIGGLAAGAWMMRDLTLAGGEVEIIAGQLLVPSSGELVTSGASVAAGTSLRTPPGEGAILQLADGSRIELDQRSSLTVEERANGTTLRLDRGRLLVEAAKQDGGRRLQVKTSDSLVTVVGTVFSVNAGLMGSRVGVLEGSVRVGSGGQDALLGPGQQTVSNQRLEKVALADEISWSREPERYLALLREVIALDAEVAALGREGLRTYPSLDEIIPASVQVYGAIPNAAGRLVDTWDLIADRLATNPAVSAWWSELEQQGGIAEIDRAVTLLGDIGLSLGDEVVLAGDTSGAMVLASVLDDNQLRSTVLNAIAEHGSDLGELELVDGGILPAGDGPTIWLTQGLVGIGNRNALRAVEATLAGAPSWSETEVRAAALERYQSGVEVLFVARMPVDGSSQPMLFVLEDRVVGARHETRLALDVDESADPGRALKWIAAPAAIGGLELLSADTSAAVAFAIDDPRRAAEELLAFAIERDSELAAHLEDLRTNHGIDVVEDLAAPLGGEMVVALDGPVVPKPAWKLVVEVLDPSALDATLEHLVTELNQALSESGGAATVVTSNASGLETHLVEIRTESGATTSFAWAYLDGYLVVAPSSEAIVRTEQNRANGYTLAQSSKLRDAMPIGSENGISGLLWLDLSGVAGAFDLLAASLPPELRTEASQLLMSEDPLVGVLLAEPGHVELVGSRVHSPLGWLRVALLAGLLHGQPEAAGADAADGTV